MTSGIKHYETSSQPKKSCSFALAFCRRLLRRNRNRYPVFFKSFERNTGNFCPGVGKLGTEFSKKGERPIGNAEISELSTLNAAYCQDTKEKVIYLTFDCGYENGNSGQILDALKKKKA